MYLAYRFFLAVNPGIVNNDNALTKYPCLHCRYSRLCKWKMLFFSWGNK